MADKAQKKGRANRRALGRGLDALLPSKPAEDKRYGAQAVFSCPIERLVPRDDQPRQQFDASALDELAATIREHGIIQPIVVRRIGEPGSPAERFEIIAGERRWRAAQRAGLKEVPVVVKDVSPEKAFELALIENVQRQDLNPIEVAEAYQRLIDDLGHTQDQLAERVGKSRVAVTNALRLLRLPEAVRALVSEGSLSEGHGRAIVGLPDERTMVELARKAVRGKLSVRKLERLVRASRGDGDAPPPPPPGADEKGKSAAVRDLEERLARRLGARTQVEHKGPGGRLVIRYADLDELDRIIATLGA